VIDHDLAVIRPMAVVVAQKIVAEQNFHVLSGVARALF
jgi:hypothetical protein